MLNDHQMPRKPRTVREQQSELFQDLLTHAQPEPRTTKQRRYNTQGNRIDQKDRPFHEWYRFVLSFPPHLVRNYIEKFSMDGDAVLLDPFCGCGTTLVEGKLARLKAVGVEANPFAHFASAVKTDWEINPAELREDAEAIAERTLSQLEKEGLNDAGFISDLPKNTVLQTLPENEGKLLLANSISPLPLHKSLILLENIKKLGHERFRGHEFLAFSKAVVFAISNLHFGPEVGIGPNKADVPVVSTWMQEINEMAKDLAGVSHKKYPPSRIVLADARNISEYLPAHSVDMVITSPPYPNEKDYTRTTRLESVLLGFIHDKAELRALKSNLIRSNTRNVYKNDDDDKWVASYKEIQRISQAIEKRRIELNKDSGFEKLYGRVTKLYFGGMARHLSSLSKVLRPGAKLAYVVGDQASYLRVMIRTGQLLSEISELLGYKVLGLDLFRTRFASATKEQMREEVLLLEWPNRKVRRNGK